MPTSRVCAGRPTYSACLPQELELKTGMALDLMKTRDRTTLTAYLSAWTLQVFVNDDELQQLAEQIETENVLAASSST